MMATRTYIHINDQLLTKTKIKSKEVSVDDPLRLYIAVKNQKKLLSLWGKIKIDENAF